MTENKIESIKLGKPKSDLSVDVKIVADAPEFIPKQGSKHAAGYDVVAREIVMKKSSTGLISVKLGIRLHCPGHHVLLIPRSSLSKSGWMLANSVGLIDEDYTGELEMRFSPIRWQPNKLFTTSASLRKMSLPRFPYKPGDRVGQIILQKTLPIQFTQVDSLEETERGEGGFGHTGK